MYITISPAVNLHFPHFLLYHHYHLNLVWASSPGRVHYIHQMYYGGRVIFQQRTQIIWILSTNGTHISNLYYKLIKHSYCILKCRSLSLSRWCHWLSVYSSWTHGIDSVTHNEIFYNVNVTALFAKSLSDLVILNMIFFFFLHVSSTNSD